MEPTSTNQTPDPQGPIVLPRIIIKYCTKCKWMLRAAYYAQELLSTFNTTIGEIALVPSTNGIFTIDIVHTPLSSTATATAPQTTHLWHRETDGGFPEIKQLKQRVRDVVDPGRGLGHVEGRRRGGEGEGEGEGEEAREGVGVVDAEAGVGRGDVGGGGGG